MSLTIWTNVKFSATDMLLLVEGTRGHKLVVSEDATASALVPGRQDPLLGSADIAFGQPDVAQCLASPRLRWVEVHTAGYTRYDTPEFREGFRARGAIFSNASEVFADACAQHALAMMLSLGRCLPGSLKDQLGPHHWGYAERRYASRLLTGQTVLMLGFGAIGRRLAELLAPFGMNLIAVRRQVRSERGVRIIPEDKVSTALAEADHVVNVLPENASTLNYVNARRLACIKPGARFYNVGRGSTVDERALIDAIRSGRISEAYLDVFATEPLPAESPFWDLPNCYVTPHTAGGRHDQDTAIVKHFVRNLDAFLKNKPMVDRIV